MRLTFNTQYNNSSAGIEGAAERLAEFQRQVSSGRRIEKPSDDPIGTSTAIAERDQLATVDRYTRSADSVQSRLSVVDTVLSSVIDKISAAQVTATSARNSTATQAQRDAAAQSLIGTRDSLVDDLNTVFRGTYLFGGAAATIPPYAIGALGTVSAYAGSTREVHADISQGKAVTIAYDGSAIVDAGAAGDVFSVLTDLATAVKTGDQNGVTAGMASLAAVFTQTTGAQSRIGVDMQSVDTGKAHLAQMRLAGQGRVSTIEDVNMAAALAGMSQADTAYRAALGAASVSGRVSLLDYLK